MKISIESTDQVTIIDGLRCRVWKGLTSEGVPCQVFIHRIGVEGNQDNFRFALELEELPPPRFVPIWAVQT
jgi:hypothetical protein